MVTRPALPLPPFNMIGKALSKICLEEVDYASLIRNSSLASSGVVLPGTENVSGEYSVASHGAGSPLESRPEASSFSPREPDVLTAWLVSGKLSRHKDFLSELQNYS